MYYFLAHIPKIDFTDINKIRDKYDANSKFLAPHIALIFPLDNSVGEQALVGHIQDVLSAERSFDIHLTGLSKSWDHYLFLEIKEGRAEIIQLHDKLYSGILEKHWLKEVQYNPHITLGFFADRQAKFDMSDIDQVNFLEQNYNSALSQASESNLEYITKFDKLSLISREDKQSPGQVVAEFRLKDWCIYYPDLLF